MSETSARLGLPFLAAGQAQKELYHNEALQRIDMAVHAVVEGAPLALPPASPAEGQCWIVASGSSGAWVSKTGALAGWSGGGWRFVDPVPGMMAWDRVAGFWRCYDGAVWQTGSLSASALIVGGQQVVGARQPTVLNPSGGTTIDAEARTAIAKVIATLMSHGLTA